MKFVYGRISVEVRLTVRTVILNTFHHSISMLFCIGFIFTISVAVLFAISSPVIDQTFVLYTTSVSVSNDVMCCFHSPVYTEAGVAISL